MERMRLVLGWAVTVASMVFGVAGALAAPPTTALGYAGFGLDRVELGAKSRVQGDVGCLFDQLAIGPGTHISASAAAPAITLGRSVRAGDGYFCATISGADEPCMA